MEAYLVSKILPTEETIGGAVLACVPIVGIYVELVHIMNLQRQLLSKESSKATWLNLIDRMNVQKQYNIGRNLITSVALIALGCLTGGTGLIVTGVLYFGASTYWNLKQFQRNHTVHYDIRCGRRAQLNTAG